MQEISYTTINHDARKKLGLSMNEYAVVDLIYHLSNNPKNENNGWCYASKSVMADMLDIARQNIHNIIKRLLDKKLVEKHKETKYLRTTSLWYEAVVIITIGSNESLHPVTNRYTTSNESLHHPVTNRYTYNNIYNNKYNMLLKEYRSLGTDDVSVRRKMEIEKSMNRLVKTP